MTLVQIIAAIYFGALFIAFLFASNNTRAILVLLSFYTYGFNLFFGLTLDTPGVTALASTALIFAGVVRLTRECRILLQQLVPFIAWTLAVVFVGYGFLERDLGRSWAQGSNGKPIVQTVAFFLDFAFVPILAGGLRSRVDLQRLIKWWIYIALFSSFLCAVQVVYHKLTGSALWGLLGRDEDEAFAGIRIFGHLFQRANALGGEPKQQAILMFFGFVVSVAAPSLGVKLPLVVRMAAPWCMLAALVLTFSSGGFLVVGLFAIYSLFNSAKHVWHLRKVAMACIVAVASAVALFPEQMANLYEVRIARIVDKMVNARTVAIGAGRVEKATDDKEIPAMAYLLRNPLITITGVGLGCSPFYYNHLVDRLHRGSYQEPNGGLTRSLYGFGFIGIGLFLYALWPYLGGSAIPVDVRPFAKNFSVAMGMAFIPLGLNFWLTFLVGLLAGLAGLPQIRVISRPVNAARGHQLH